MDPDRYIKWKEVTEDDIKSGCRKTLLTQTSELKTSIVNKYMKKRLSSNRKVKSSDIADDLGYSTATIARYKKDIGVYSNRKQVHRTREEQNKITMKALITKLNNTELNDDEYKERYNRIVRKYGSTNPETSNTRTTLNPRGGTFKATNSDDDEPRTISEEEAQQRMQKVERKNTKITTADSLIQNSLDRISAKLN